MNREELKNEEKRINEDMEIVDRINKQFKEVLEEYVKCFQGNIVVEFVNDTKKELSNVYESVSKEMNKQLFDIKDQLNNLEDDGEQKEEVQDII